jgi:Tol biopolymer transport system component/predicted Ser/Thr protein kinase
MDPARWKRVEEIYHAASERKAAERAAFLAVACAGDDDLRSEVESLLAQPSAEGPLDRPTWDPAASCGDMSSEAARPAVGQRVAHYEIQAKLGEGGMGAVYRAYDTQLRRPVALKILLPAYASDPERRSRLLREARAASALSHPNIVSIHEAGSDNGVDFIAMEFVEGKSLGQIIPAKGMPLGQALDCAVQMASGLAKAHAAGVIHRDLKPGNIMLSRDGLVKLLDFGLARRVELGPGHDTTLTIEGQILGTPSYMSPEQAQGKPVDVRSDVFSFGSVLYEIVTGKRAFEKGSHVATLAAVVEVEPPALPSSVPRDLERIVTRCLRKDPAQRFQHMDDVKVDLEELKKESESGQHPGITAVANASRKRWRRLPLLLLVASLACAVALFIWTRPDRLPAEMKPLLLFSTGGQIWGVALSPDGSRVAYQWVAPPEASHDGNDDPCGIYVKQVRGGPPVRLTRDETDRSLAWSPDDRYIAFWRLKERAILLVPSIGGPERRIAKLDLGGPSWNYSGISWTPDAKWLVVSTRDSPNEPYGLWLLSVDTGERHRLLPLPASAAPSGAQDDAPGDFHGALSPDGRFLAFARSFRNYVFHLYTVRLTRDFQPQGAPQLLVGQSYWDVLGITWASNRDIVYCAGGLWRMRVGARSPELLSWAGSGGLLGRPVAAAQRRLAYVVSSDTGKLWRVDLRTGERRMIVDSRYFDEHPQYSPDGRKLAFQSVRTGNTEVWTCDAEGTNCQQLTFFQGPTCGTPRWSPDGRWIALDSRVEGTAQIYVIPSDGGTPRRVTGDDAQNQIPSWSRDGKWIYFESDRSGQWRIWKAPVEGGSAVQVTQKRGGMAFESVDGKYLYFTEHSGYGLFRMPVAGGLEVEIAPKVVMWDSFSVTAKGVYFLPDLKKLQLFDAATGKITTVAKAEKYSFGGGFGGGISVSPDDAYMVFAEVVSGGSDLMLVENLR